MAGNDSENEMRHELLILIAYAGSNQVSLHIKSHQRFCYSLTLRRYRVHTTKAEINSRFFQGVLTNSPTVFKHYMSMKNINLNFNL